MSDNFKTPKFIETPPNKPELDISYTLNSNGYRTIEFDKIDYNNSIFLFGCSMTFGQAINDDETIAAYLEKILKIPVINLGVRSSSIVFNLYNQIILRETNCKPLAIINLWTSLYRNIYFCNSNTTHLGNWTNKGSKYFNTFYSMWSQDESNVKISNMFNKRMADLLWDGIPHIQASFFAETAKLFDIKCLEWIDRGSDGSHTGPKTALNTAEQLATKFRQLTGNQSLLNNKLNKWEYETKLGGNLHL